MIKTGNYANGLFDITESDIYFNDGRGHRTNEMRYFELYQYVPENHEKVAKEAFKKAREYAIENFKEFKG